MEGREGEERESLIEFDRPFFCSTPPHPSIILHLPDADVSLADVDARVAERLAAFDGTPEERAALLARLERFRRAMAAVLVLRTAELSGHAAMPRERLKSEVRRVLRGGARHAAATTSSPSPSPSPADDSPLPERELAASCQSAHIAAMIEDGVLVEDTVRGEACLFQPDMYAVERAVAAHLKRLAAADAPQWRDQLAGAPPPPSRAALSAHQQEVADAMLRSRLAVLTGGPGTGKTTLLRYLVDALRGVQRNVLLCSPTGRAARRLEEATGHQAHTVHMAINLDLPREADAVVVDEASVLDARVLAALLEQLPPGAALYFVGDVDQLPPVGPSPAMAALVGWAGAPVHRLVEVHRQVGGGGKSELDVWVDG